MTALVLGLALLFGAADQYLGSLSAHPWAADVSGLSAPWLVLPFVVGCCSRSARRACWTGGAATFLALAGYCLMTLSPLENAHLSVDGVVAFVSAGNWRWFVAGAVTGPIAGLLGHRWRHAGVTLAGLGAGAVLALEPLVRLRTGFAVRSGAVAAVEIGAGALAAGWVALGPARGSGRPT